MLNTAVLVLNRNFQPIHVTNVKRAFSLLYQGLARAVDALRNGTFAGGDHDRFRGIADNISGPDYFLVASDFTDYWRAGREADAAYLDRDGWTRAAALNTARSGWFSSDRTIRGYAREIWDALPPQPLRKIAAE